jgi:TrmH family RNA methyltransferase
VSTAITSRQHPFIRRCRDLAEGRGAHNEILLDGPHLIEEALAAGVPLVGLVADDRAGALAERAAHATSQVLRANTELVDAASPVKSSSGIVAIARWSPADATSLLAADAPVVIGLVGVQDPGNVGGIIRSADALGAAAVLTLDDTAHPGGWRALRGAMGSTFRVPVGRGDALEVLTAARRQGFTIVATVAQRGTSLDRAAFKAPVLFLVGNEGAGLPETLAEAADLRVTIPMRAGVNSLNVGVSAALLLWVARHQQG